MELIGVLARSAPPLKLPNWAEESIRTSQILPSGPNFRIVVNRRCVDSRSFQCPASPQKSAAITAPCHREKRKESAASGSSCGAVFRSGHTHLRRRRIFRRCQGFSRNGLEFLARVGYAFEMVSDDVDTRVTLNTHRAQKSIGRSLACGIWRPQVMKRKPVRKGEAP
jgi:hypothetical protein